MDSNNIYKMKKKINEYHALYAKKSLRSQRVNIQPLAGVRF
jgi:hypothetical protein